MVKDVTADAYIEGLIELTLDCVDEAYHSCEMQLSTDWLRNSKLREKIHFELHRLTNTKQVQVLLQYCLKTILVLEQTARDMGISRFEGRLDKIRETLMSSEKLVLNICNIQYLWQRSFEFVKFSSRGEIERDNLLMYQSCTEDFKKIEAIFQDRGGNLSEVHQKLIEFNIGTEKLLLQLSVVVEDVYSNIQTMLDAAPRLSLLSFSKLFLLIKAWLVTPVNNMPIISSCFREIFPGVGHLSVIFVPGKKQEYYCSGFKSIEFVETILFDSPLSFSLALDDFVREFEAQLRKVLSTKCDALMLNRVLSLRSLLGTTSTK
jgi:hypothetical protein